MTEQLSNQAAQAQYYRYSLSIAFELITRRSVTPKDADCQQYIASVLERVGFECNHFHVEGVSNLIARIGSGKRHIAFSGHTDVVPSGPIEKWCSEPFTPTIKDGYLHGRGAADMKTGIAAMLAAVLRKDWKRLHSDNSFWLLITSDEEGEAENGSAWIKRWLDNNDICLETVLVGEPTAIRHSGDTVKLGRRGSLSGQITITGKQGHVAYPHQTVNAASIAVDVAQALTQCPFDLGSPDFPGTSLQITQLDSGTFSDNIVPGLCTVCFNVRYTDEYSVDHLKAKLTEVVDENAMDYELQWQRPCDAYLSKPLNNAKYCLINQIESAIFSATGKYPLLSTAGGTSDGRFFASKHTQVVEVGVPNRTIHQINECIDLADLYLLDDIYTAYLTEALF